MRSIISLAKPLSLADEQGNKYSVSQISGDISVSGGSVHFQPTLHQCRDAINRKANPATKPSDGPMGRGSVSHTEVFVLQQSDVQADEELSILIEQISIRVTELIKAKLEAIA